MPMAIKKLLERNALVIAILLTLVIAFLSLVSLKGIHVIKVKNSDKYSHFIAYFVLCLSWLFAHMHSSKLQLKKLKKYTIVLFLIVYGIIIEVLQGVLTTYRQADFFDFLANSAGVLMAAFIFEKVRRFL